MSYAMAENKHAIRHNLVVPGSLTCFHLAEVYRVAADHVVVPRAREVLGGGSILRWRRHLEGPPLHIVRAPQIVEEHKAEAGIETESEWGDRHTRARARARTWHRKSSYQPKC